VFRTHFRMEPSFTIIDRASLKIPRFVKSTKSNDQLLLFCDASAKAYATVVYLKIKDTNFTSFYSQRFNWYLLGKGNGPNISQYHVWNY